MHQQEQEREQEEQAKKYQPVLARSDGNSREE